MLAAVLELEPVVGAAVVVVVVVNSVVVVVGCVLLATGATAAMPVPVLEPVSNSTESGDEGNVGFRLSARPTGPRSAASAISGQFSSSGWME